MQLRTDLALEAHELSGGSINGAEINQSTEAGMTASEIRIISSEAAEKLGKPKGTYITFENLVLTDDFTNAEEKIKVLAAKIHELLPPGPVMVAGIGSTSITSDALGPKSTSYILATRHIESELKRSLGLDTLRDVSVIAPGVTGETGIESGEMIISLVKRLNPSAVIAVDALAARSLSRLGCTIQISDSGITPGSGVGNHRMTLSKETLGIPVISVGIPTVVDALTLAHDILSITDSDVSIEHTVNPRGEQMIVTPREIDILTERGAKLAGMAINYALQYETDYETLMLLSS